ncbi:accessory factor UbiK family protein [Kiloniella laminariae]|uniref:Accessory factor UbiK family protein n=1 Tax=Kiloniella laminariae TaxID=454162 RepID=A0ABT4LLP7_9PROT|nr:accessory factor UbiK family protein [Kiloniella laminariae]MCZ4281865.1 accessory factor UbiK family protein [Kiloniella laminariae]
MQTQNRILDDMAKVASSAMGAAAGMRGEIEARVREQFERILSQMDVVPREEFEAMKAVAVKAREVGEDLADKVTALEARLSALEASTSSTTATAKKTSTKTTVKNDKAEG